MRIQHVYNQNNHQHYTLGHMEDMIVLIRLASETSGPNNGKMEDVLFTQTRILNL